VDPVLSVYNSEEASQLN